MPLVLCVLMSLLSGGSDRGATTTLARVEGRARSATAGQSVSATAKQTLAWLPDEKGVDGWKRAKAPQVFGPDDLWEFIDGAADTYVIFGFQELVSVTCAHAALKTEATIDVYRMADALNAFGIYAQERSSKATFLPIGAEGYAQPNVLNFWSGPYYVKLRATSSNARIAASLQALAKRIATGMGRPVRLPAAVPAFPPSGLLPHTLRYLPRNVLGQSYLSNGFEAQYAGAKPWRLVAVSFDSDEDASKAFVRYKSFMASSARVTREIPSPGSGGFAGSDPYNGSIVVIRSGSKMLVALGAPSEKAAVDLIRRFLSGSRPLQEMP